MKKVLIILSIILLFFTCKKDGIPFKNYKVDFYTSHPKLSINPVQFEWVTEQVLVKPVYRKGAKFTWVQDTLLVRQAYTVPHIMDSMRIPMVINAEADIAQNVFCYAFYDGITLDTIPAEYMMLDKEKLVKDGTDGPEIPAQYITVHKQVVEKQARLVEHSDEQTFNRVYFHIPSDVSIEDYLKQQIGFSQVDHCEEGVSYKIEK